MKKIAVINDLSGFGRCSLTAALPVISAFGIEACPLPTAILSSQTGYPSFFCTDYTENLIPYIDEWKRRNVSFDAVLTGYMASEKQADIICDFVDTFKTDNTLIFVDPVMADDGVLYDTYNTALCEKVIELTKKANIITPNLTELCILCGADYERVSAENNVDKIQHLAASLLSDNLETVIVTGVKKNKEIYNIIVEKDKNSFVKSKLLDGSFSGTGDIFSSVVCGSVVKSKSVTDAVTLATSFIEKSIADTPHTKGYAPDGIDFQKHLEVLINEK